MSKNTNISELINYLSYDGSGNIVFTTVSAAATNTDKFLVSDAGTLKFRTAAQLLSDIGAQASGSYQAALSGTGFVKISGSTISYDNSTYLTTSSAASTYLPLTGGTVTGPLVGTSATFNSSVSVGSGSWLTFNNVNTIFSQASVGFFLQQPDGSTPTTFRNSVGGSQMTITSGGNVGIGTTNPAYKLDVSGEIGLDSYLRHNGDTDTFFGFSNNDEIKFRTAGTDRLTIASTGAATFSSSLTVNGVYNVPSTSYFKGNASFGYRFNNAADTVNLFILADSGAATFSSTLTSTDHTIKNSANSETLDLFLSPSTLNGFIDYPSGRSLTIRNKGSLGSLVLASTGAATFSSNIVVGPGTQAVSNDAELTLREGVAFVGLDFKSARTSGNIGGLRFYGTSSDSVPVSQILAETDGQLVFRNGTSAQEQRLTIASTGAATFSNSVTAQGNINIIASSAPQLLFFESSSSYTEGMRVLRSNDKLHLTYGWNADEEALTVVGTGTTTGFVGIGTVSPSTRLNVSHPSHGIGISYMGGSALPSIAGLFTDSSSGGQGYGSLLIKSRTDYAGYSINFYTAGTANVIESRMMITSVGNIGVNCVPDHKLDVNGTTRIQDTTMLGSNVGLLQMAMDGARWHSYPNTVLHIKTSILKGSDTMIAFNIRGYMYSPNTVDTDVAFYNYAPAGSPYGVTIHHKAYSGWAIGLYYSSDNYVCFYVDGMSTYGGFALNWINTSLIQWGGRVFALASTKVNTTAAQF